MLKALGLSVFILILTGCQTLNNPMHYEFKAVQIENRSNGICPNKLDGKVIIGENGMQGWVPIPLHGITLSLWSEVNKDGFISSGSGTGQYVTKINFFLSQAPGYWVGVMKVLADEGRANGICEYKIFAVKDVNSSVKNEMLLSNNALRATKENINLNTFEALENYALKHRKDSYRTLAAIDSFSASEEQRALLRSKINN